MSKRPPTAAEKRYWEWLPDVCAGCGSHENIVLHHIISNAPGKRSRRDNMLVVKLDAGCHNMRTDSIHLLGSEDAFQRVHDVDLVAIAVLNRDAWEKRNVG